jgi:signal transduction histidine kinase
VVLANSGEIDRGFAFGELAEQVGRTFGDPVQFCRARHFFTHHVRHWRAPLREHPDRCRDVHEIALDRGELAFAAYSTCAHSMAIWALGNDLAESDTAVTRGLTFCSDVSNEPMVTMHTDYLQAIRTLRSPEHRGGRFGEPGFHEGIFLERVANNGSAVFLYQALRMQVAWLLRDLETAQERARIAMEMRPAAFGTIAGATVPFYAGLVGATCAESPEAGRAVLAPLLEQHRQWAEGCPTNFSHQYALLRAEDARLAGDEHAALQSYDRAIEEARGNGFTHEQAIACELAARYHLAMGRTATGRVLLESAMRGYVGWGAEAKTAQLRAEFPLLRAAPRDRHPTAPVSLRDDSGSGFPSEVDVDGLFRTMAAVSSIQALEPLLCELLAVVAQSAGAERGYLLLVDGIRMRVRASLVVGSDAELCDAAPAALALPLSLLRRASNRADPLIVDDAEDDPELERDPTLAEREVRSILCLPLRRRGRLLAIVYLENNLLPRAFNESQAHELRLISTHLAIALENAAAITAERDENRRRRVAEARLERQAEALAQSNQELEAVLFATSHHLREPARSVANFADLLQADLSDTLDEGATELLARLRGAATRIHVLLGDITRYADVAHREPVSGTIALGGALARARELVHATLEASGAHLEVVGPLPRVSAAPGTAVATFAELLENAVKFHEGPGAHIRIEGQIDGDEVRVTVTDDGPGVPEAWRKRVFEPLRRLGAGTTDLPIHGHDTGIGLALVRRLINTSGGRMGLDAAEDGGTVAWFTLPVAAD